MIDFEKVQELKQRLDTLSNQLTERIHHEEEKLHALGLGIQCWVKTSDQLKIGYVREKGRWQLCIRENDEYTWPMKDAPRNYKLHGARNIGLLHEALIKTAEGYIGKIEKYLMGEPDPETTAGPEDSKEGTSGA